MNFDLGIKYSYITGIFLTSAAVAGPVIDTNLPSKPTDGVWSNQYVLDLNNPVGPDGPRVVLPNEENSDGKNYQINALYDFLSLYSVTRDNGNKSNGWDDLPVNNGSATQKEIIRNALFGDGTASGSLIRSVAIGGTGTQAPYERMKDVLRALDVPPNVSRNGTEYNVIGHYNHFHLNIQPPTKKPVEIGGSGNLLAAATTMTDASTSRAADVPVTSQAQYDATFSICQAVAPVGGQDFPVANQLYPHAAATAFFNARGIALEQSEPTKIMLVEVPRHGGLVPDTKFPHSVFVYHPNEGYFGSDQMTFSVEVKGKIFKVVYSVDVVRAPDYGSPDCPTGFDIKELPDSATGNGKGSSLDIIELPTDGSVDVEALAKLHSIVSFSLGADSLGDGGSFSFANLAGGAVGQTTGHTITLDDNANGYNWYVDLTPGLNEEFLPTSNPYEWVAKPGSEAEGKMDLLTVLLHEAAHALGLDHTADAHALMAPTLQPGVRRLPSPEVLAELTNPTIDKAPLSESLGGQAARRASAGLANANSSECNAADGRPAARPSGAPQMERLGVAALGKGLAIPCEPRLDPRHLWGSEWGLVDGWVSTARSGDTASATTASADSGVPGAPAPDAPLPLGTGFTAFWLGRMRKRGFGYTLESLNGEQKKRELDSARYEVAPNPALLNPEFAGNDGWNTTGPVTFGNNAAVLAESATAQTRLNQLFVLGEHDRFLRFTLDDVQGSMSVAGGTTPGATGMNSGPNDAFEVALIDANTGQSLLGGTGLSRSDALLNLQADGTEQAAAQVSATPNADGSRTYLVDLTGIASGTIASLSFDLIGFGRGQAAASSRITVRDLKLGIPETYDDAAATLEDTPVTIAALANDLDADQPGFAPVVVTGPAHGQVVINTDGTFGYTPAQDWSGQDSFSYKLSDGSVDSNIATVSVTVTAVNDAPVAADAQLATLEEQALVIDLRNNAYDVDNGQAELTGQIITGPAHGTLAPNGDGTYTYTPAADFNGVDSFTYRLNDGELDSNTATVIGDLPGLRSASVANQHPRR